MSDINGAVAIRIAKVTFLKRIAATIFFSLYPLPVLHFRDNEA